MVDGAEGGVAFGRLRVIMAVRVVVMVVMVVMMVMCRSGLYNLLCHGFDHGVSNVAVFGGRVF